MEVLLSLLLASASAPATEFARRHDSPKLRLAHSLVDRKVQLERAKRDTAKMVCDSEALGRNIPR